MKRYGNLFDKICDIDNIRLAHKNARKKKTHYKEVVEVDKDVEKYCSELKELLESGKFKNSEYLVFTKNDKGKQRTIYKLPYYPDRIVHHAIVQILEPIWKSTLIKGTYQSIKGRGIHKAVRSIQKYLHSSDVPQYYLQMDISKYYPSIDNSKLKQVLRRKIKCTKTLVLLDNIVDSVVGVPIGNYLSQYFGNLYLSDVDHYVKEVVKIKEYYRYCDDLVIVAADKRQLHECKHAVNRLVIGKALKLKPGTRLRPISTGLDFLGVVLFTRYTKLRKRIKHRLIKALAKTNNRNVIMSYYGWMLLCNGKTLWYKYMKEIR